MKWRLGYMKGTKELTKQIILIALAIAMVVTLIPVLNIGTCDVSEASASLYANDEYKVLIDITTVDENTVVKVGKYYFKYKLDKDSLGYVAYVIYISTNSKSGFKKTPIDFQSNACTNGKQAYYIKGEGNGNFVLCKYVFSSRKETKIKKMPVKNYQSEKLDTTVDYYSVTYVYGDIVAINGILDDGPQGSYTYNLKTKKLSVLSYGFFTEGKNRYIIVKEPGDYVPKYADHYAYYYKTYLYKITSSGIEKVRDLSQRDGGSKIVGDKIIYIDINSKFTKTYIYECNLDGSGKKRLASFNGWYKALYDANGDITSNYCILRNMDKFYSITDGNEKNYYVVYNFKTKKKAALSQSASEITPIGNKIYYLVCFYDSTDNIDIVKAILYKCNVDGSGKKKIATLKTGKKMRVCG
jgi:hypothetical protein